MTLCSALTLQKRNKAERQALPTITQGAGAGLIPLLVVHALSISKFRHEREQVRDRHSLGFHPVLPPLPVLHLS